MAVAMVVREEFLTGKGAFLYPPAGEVRFELVGRLTSVSRRSRTKLRSLDALSFIPNVTLPLTVPQTPSPRVPVVADHAGQPGTFTLPIHQNETIDH